MYCQKIARRWQKYPKWHRLYIHATTKNHWNTLPPKEFLSLFKEETNPEVGRRHSGCRQTPRLSEAGLCWLLAPKCEDIWAASVCLAVSEWEGKQWEPSYSLGGWIIRGKEQVAVRHPAEKKPCKGWKLLNYSLTPSAWILKDAPCRKPAVTAAGLSQGCLYLLPAETLTFGWETFPAAAAAARFVRRLQQWDSQIPSHTGDAHTHTRYLSRGGTVIFHIPQVFGTQ